MAEKCGNCRFCFVGDDKKHECRRRAPLPFDFIRFHELELLRDIAWSMRVVAKIPEPHYTDDVATAATEATSYAAWPNVIPTEDWCGEWEGSK